MDHSTVRYTSPCTPTDRTHCVAFRSNKVSTPLQVKLRCYWQSWDWTLQMLWQMAEFRHQGSTRIRSQRLRCVQTRGSVSVHAWPLQHESA